MGRVVKQLEQHSGVRKLLCIGAQELRRPSAKHVACRILCFPPTHNPLFPPFLVRGLCPSRAATPDPFAPTREGREPVSYTHLRAHETSAHL
eukprot:3186156-Alexandrium_andersonii.AAC.1